MFYFGSVFFFEYYSALPTCQNRRFCVIIAFVKDNVFKRIMGEVMIILNDQKEILNEVVGNLKIVADCL